MAEDHDNFIDKEDDRYVNLELVCLSETTVLKVLGDSGAAILIKVSNGRK